MRLVIFCGYRWMLAVLTRAETVFESVPCDHGVREGVRLGARVLRLDEDDLGTLVFRLFRGQSRRRFLGLGAGVSYLLAGMACAR
jgi:hypothetical protein